jgi:hypothetical protein
MDSKHLGLIAAVLCALAPMAARADTTMPPSRYPLESVVIRLRSTGSHGVDIVIRGSGLGHIRGRGADRDFTVDGDMLQGLLRSFYDAHFFELADVYRRRNTVVVSGPDVIVSKKSMFDQDNVTTAIDIGDYHKQVFDEQGAPDALLVLEETIMRAAGVNDVKRQDWGRGESIDVVAGGTITAIDTVATRDGAATFTLETVAGESVTARVPLNLDVPPQAPWEIELHRRFRDFKVGDRVFVSGRGRSTDFYLRTIDDCCGPR